MSTHLDLSRHPCFNPSAQGSCGRIHLPVAAHCNIKCNYCNRKYDCVNESRPGVTSAVLSPLQAVRYTEKVLAAEPRITVAGIAGPGDPFANPVETMETLRFIRREFPHLLLCLSTNGLGLADHLDELKELQVSHVTITVNAVDPAIGRKITSWVREKKVIYRGLQGAQLLLERQLSAIEGLKRRGMTVKVNTIVIPGVNDHHVEEVARRMAELGVDVLNCMPMFPNSDTPFEDIGEPDAQMMEEIREKAGRHIHQMKHCQRCRADAVGLLHEDRSDEFRNCLSACSQTSSFTTDRKPYVAVASVEGVLVNLHLGEAASFEIWEENSAGGFRRIQERPAPEPGTGDERWLALAWILHDCRAVLVNGVGEKPRKILEKCGVQPVEMNGFISFGLEAIYRGGNLSVLKGRHRGCSRSCGGQGDGAGCG